jgi:tetratricopeptide (TPR) repeat protein
MKPLLLGKAILIVEDYPTMRKAIRNMLYTLDADTIYEADSGINALDIMRNKSLDVVLCDYNLGPGKNGQQVLEEARLLKLIGTQCVFIIIAAEQSASLVLGAMDSKPDEYLTKPFNAQQLFVRLERNLARKALLQNIERDIERGSLAQAIQQCDKLLAGNNNKMRTHLLKMRAELAALVGDFETGRRIYNEILQERDLPWARLGLGIIAFRQGEYERATELFEALVRDHPLFLEGYDWLSTVYEAEDKMLNLQEVINQAVDLSPQSILRQKKLAQAADKNGNVDVAEKAYKAAVTLGKHSIHKDCSDFTNLAKLYNRTQADDKALATLTEMRREYKNNPEAELRAFTLESAVHKSSGNDEKAEAALQTALALRKQIGDQCPKDLQLDLARSCFLHNKSAEGEAILQQAIKSNIDDDNFLGDTRRMLKDVGLPDHSEALIQDTKRALVATNNKGVALYKQGKFDEAMALFERAMITMPQNQTILINMLKITLHDLQTAEYDEDKLRRTQALLVKARQIGVEKHKLGILQMEFSNILRRFSAAGT